MLEKYQQRHHRCLSISFVDPEQNGSRTAHALSIDDGRVTEDHVTCALFVHLGNSCSDCLQSENSTIGETGDGTLSKVLNDVGNRIRLGSEEVVDFFEDTVCQRNHNISVKRERTFWRLLLHCHLGNLGNHLEPEELGMKGSRYIHRMSWGMRLGLVLAPLKLGRQRLFVRVDQGKKGEDIPPATARAEMRMVLSAHILMIGFVLFVE